MRNRIFSIIKSVLAIALGVWVALGAHEYQSFYSANRGVADFLYCFGFMAFIIGFLSFVADVQGVRRGTVALSDFDVLVLVAVSNFGPRLSGLMARVKIEELTRREESVGRLHSSFHRLETAGLLRADTGRRDWVKPERQNEIGPARFYTVVDNLAMAAALEEWDKRRGFPMFAGFYDSIAAVEASCWLRVKHGGERQWGGE